MTVVDSVWPSEYSFGSFPAGSWATSFCWKARRPVPLGGRACEILIALVERSGAAGHQGRVARPRVAKYICGGRQSQGARRPLAQGARRRPGAVTAILPVFPAGDTPSSLPSHLRRGRRICLGRSRPQINHTNSRLRLLEWWGGGNPTPFPCLSGGAVSLRHNRGTRRDR